MRVRRALCCAWIAIALTGKPAVAASTVEPGTWRITWALESIRGRQGIPPEFLDLQTVTATRCLDRVPSLPLPPGQDSGCQVDLVAAEQERIEWRGQCQGADGRLRRVQGRVAYRGSALDGSLVIDTNGVTMTFDVRGRLYRPECR